MPTEVYELINIRNAIYLEGLVQLADRLISWKCTAKNVQRSTRHNVKADKVCQIYFSPRFFVFWLKLPDK